VSLSSIKSDSGIIYRCSCCGQEYGELPLTFGSDFPDYYYSIPPEEREKRIEITESLCVVDGEHFFHRGRLAIPIINFTEELIFNVWTSISEENFKKRNELWDDSKRVQESPYFGWLQNIIPCYGNTLNLKTIAIESEVGFIPMLKAMEDDHQLTLDQNSGISFERAIEIAGSILQNLHTSNKG
jgi:hypothetical protein